MTINKQNIDEVIFEYLEGNLNLKDSNALMLFLDQHPEYKAELDSWEQSYVRDETTHVAPDFSSLKQKSKTMPYVVGGIAAMALLLWGINQSDSIDTADSKPEPTTIEQRGDITPNVGSEILDHKEERADKSVIEPTIEPRNQTPEIKGDDGIIMKEGDVEYTTVEVVNERKVSLETTKTNREASLQKVALPKTAEEEKNKRSKEVKVIELNSEGL